MRIGIKRFLLAIGLVMWALAICLGVGGVWAYSAGEGEAAHAPSEWPSGTSLSLEPNRPTLIMFIHPHCPCSRASVAELERIVAQCVDHVAVRVVFVKPVGASENWEQTDLWKQVRKTAQVQRLIDENAVEATRFRAATSGQALLYSSTGRLLFRGGITGARGEQGDNAGSSSVTAIIRKQKALEQTPVFGCPLVRESEDQPKKKECRP